MSILDEIVLKKREEVLRIKKNIHVASLEHAINKLPYPRDFGAAMLKECGTRNNIIAEIKKASPSKGLIRASFNPQDLALMYEENGAVAISVLTDTTFFHGKLDDLAAVKKAVTIPVLRKDFILDPCQIYEARATGADAVLLIVAILKDMELDRLMRICAELGLAALVEVHDHEELARALSSGARIIGINNRNLNTFKTDMSTTLKLLSAIPEDATVVSESGIKSPEDIDRLRGSGVDAFLIGETLMSSPNPGTTLRKLVG